MAWGKAEGMMQRRFTVHFCPTNGILATALS